MAEKKKDIWECFIDGEDAKICVWSKDENAYLVFSSDDVIASIDARAKIPDLVAWLNKEGV